jgi:heptosyltransferase-2
VLAVRAPNWVGDVIMATPLLEAAVADPRFRRVAIVVKAHLADLLRGGPLEPHLVPLERGASEVELLRSLGAGQIALLPNSLGTAWRALRAGIGVRVGSALGGRRLLLARSALPPVRGGRRVPAPTALLYRDVMALVGVEAPDLHPRLHATAEGAERARALRAEAGLEPGRPYVVCAPGAAFGAAKLWPPASFARVLDELAERRGLAALVTGGPGEEPLIEAVVSAAGSAPISLAPFERDLETLKTLVADSELLLVGDTGPRWVAAAYDVPCVSVMGPNLPELTATSLEWCEVVRLEGLECSPCGRKRCPLEHHRCMRELDPARALVAAERLLDRRAALPAV